MNALRNLFSVIKLIKYLRKYYMDNKFSRFSSEWLELAYMPIQSAMIIPSILFEDLARRYCAIIKFN